MEICTDFTYLKSLLIKAQEIEESTLSLVFISGKLTAHDVVAMRTANKWCDVLIAVCLSDNFPTNQQKLLKDSGVDIFLSCSQDAPKLGLDSGKINSGFILKVILAVMPSAIVVQIANLNLLKVLSNINTNYENMFTPIYSETPNHILSETEQSIRQALVSIQEIIKSGEKNITVIMKQFEVILQNQSNLNGILNILSNNGNLLKEGLDSESLFLQTEVQIGSESIQDGIQISLS